MASSKLPLPAELMRQWLARTNITGCQFARAIATKQEKAVVRLSVVRNPVDDPAFPELIHTTLLEAAKEPESVLFVFPNLRGDDDIAALAVSLARNAAFKVERKEWDDPGARSDVIFLLSWQTPSGFPSRTMGFAPSGLMPVTRRAPFISLFVWTGGFDNHFRGSQSPDGVAYKSVGIVDMKHAWDSRPQYDDLWGGSKEEHKALDKEEPNESASKRDVSFCVSAKVLDQLKFS